MEYSQELINAVNKYNENLDSIADKTLRLKMQLNNEDIEVNNLQSIFGKLKVINNTKSRKQTELLTEIIHEYGYQLKCLVRGIPEDRNICKWCWHCECSKATGTAICSLDIGDKVDINGGCCDEFEYDPDFRRYLLWKLL